MIYSLLRIPLNEWQFFGFSQHKQLIRERLNWMSFDYLSIPPHKHVWAIRDEICLLLLLSTNYSTKDELIKWIRTHINAKLNTRQLALIEWAFPLKHKNESLEKLIQQATEQQLFYFTFEVLERLLLWDDPEYSWFSSYFSLVGKSREIYENSLKPIGINEQKEKIDASQHFGKYYYLNPPIEMFIVYRVYEHCTKLHNNEPLTFDIKTLSLQAYHGLLRAVVYFLKYHTRLSERALEQKYLSLQSLETQWCKGRLSQ